MELSESCAGGFEIERCQKVKENGLSHEYGAGSFSYSAKKRRKYMAGCITDIIESSI